KKIRALQLFMLVRGDALIRFACEVGRIEIRQIDFGFEHENRKPQARKPQRNRDRKNDCESPQRNAIELYQACFDTAERDRGKINRGCECSNGDELFRSAFKRFYRLLHRAAGRVEPKAVKRGEWRRFNRRRITAHAFYLRDKSGSTLEFFSPTRGFRMRRPCSTL